MGDLLVTRGRFFSSVPEHLAQRYAVVLHFTLTQQSSMLRLAWRGRVAKE